MRFGKSYCRRRKRHIICKESSIVGKRMETLTEVEGYCQVLVNLELLLGFLLAVRGSYGSGFELGHMI